MLTRALFVLLASTLPAAALELGMPLACTPGTDCFIQQYVDHDPGPEARDYMCGAETYQGHDGTDIRVKSVADVFRGVNVLAAAPGTVIGMRDGLDDHLVRNELDRSTVEGRECGNGVRLDHGDGWTTQYCHMRESSVVVKEGDKVEAGAKLGKVGYSGDAAFPHLHIQVEHDGKVVDPFQAKPDAACGDAGNQLWSDAAKTALAYRAGDILGFDIIDRPPKMENLDEGAHLRPPDPDTPMVTYVWAINLQKDDVLTVSLSKDGNMLSNNSATLDHSKAQMMLFAGKKAPEGGWPKGTYTGTVKVMRGGKAVIDQTKTIQIQ